MSDTYNGWSNRETWAANLWFNPETVDDVDFAEQEVDEQYERMRADFPMLGDICYPEAINWDEIRETVAEDSGDEDGNE